MTLTPPGRPRTRGRAQPRATAASGLPARSQQATLRALGDQRTQEIVEQYADAIERGDADTLVSMLTEDATWSMPPIPTWFRGREPVREWLVRDPLSVRWRHLPARANGQLAVGCYIYDAIRDSYTPHVIDVLSLEGGRIAAVTGFLLPDPEETAPPGARATGAEIFARFGLPAEVV